MLFQTLFDVIAAFIVNRLGFLPTVTVPELASYDISPLTSVITLALVLLPGHAYSVVIGAWGLVWAIRIGLIPIRWLLIAGRGASPK